MKRKEFKRCPRCDKKNPIFQDRCENCGLIFSRLTKATNAAAKKNIRKKEYNKVIMDSVLPRDVNKWKLFFVALFFGFFGVHYAKVGRYKMFTYGIMSAAALYIAVLLPTSWFDHQYLFFLMWALVLPASVYAILNIVSIFSIVVNKFKVPISIDEELIADSLDQNLVEDILKIAKQDNNKNCNESDKKVNINSESIKKGQVADKSKVKRKKITIVCSSCGESVRVYEGENVCPKCDEPLRED